MTHDFSVELDSIDKVPEDFRGLYTKTEDGKFKVDSSKTEIRSAVSAILGLNNALKAERAANKDLRGKITAVDLTPLKEFGETPEQIAESFKTKISEVQKSKPDIERIKSDIAQNSAKEVQALQGKISTLTDRLHSTMIEGAIASAVAGAGVDPELIRPFVREHLRVVEDEGHVAVRVVDEKKTPRYSGVTAQPMTVNELVAELKANEKYSRLFPSETKSGGGARESFKPFNGKESGKMSALEKISAGLDDGQFSKEKKRR